MTFGIAHNDPILGSVTENQAMCSLYHMLSWSIVESRNENLAKKCLKEKKKYPQKKEDQDK